MPLRRIIWRGEFRPDAISGLPCPRCAKGELSILKDSVKKLEPQYSKYGHGENSSPLEETWRFICFLQCNQPFCGELVTVQGDIDLVENYDQEEIEYEVLWTPRSMYPGPPLLSIPKAVPHSIKTELKLAFQLYWVDLGSCANRMRISVERLMDEFSIPAGKLNMRIKAFSDAYPDHAQIFDALRHVGNAGSHEGIIKRDTVLDAFEVYQYALDQLYGGEKSRIELLKKRILTALGK